MNTLNDLFDNKHEIAKHKFRATNKELLGSSCQTCGMNSSHPAHHWNDSRISWDSYFFNIALAVSKRADCTRRQVGSVIVRPDHSVVSVGYNGAPRGAPGCLSAGACPRGALDNTALAPGSSYDTGAGSCIAIHAEQNALAQARESVAGYTLYTTTEPCDGCKKVIAAYQITDVKWLEALK